MGERRIGTGADRPIAPSPYGDGAGLNPAGENHDKPSSRNLTCESYPGLKARCSISVAESGS